MSNINYRPADIHDVLPITLLWTKMIEEVFDEFIKLDKVELDNFSFAICDRLRSNNCYTQIVEDDKKIIGFLHGYLQSKPYGKPNNIAFCEARYIEKEYRGRMDIAKNMISDFTKWANDAGIMDGEFMIPYSEELVKVYKHMGYKPYAIVLRGG